MLYHSHMAFKNRLYGTLDVNFSGIKLHEPLSAIARQPLLYVRDMVPKPCFQAILRLNQVNKPLVQFIPSILFLHARE